MRLKEENRKPHLAAAGGGSALSPSGRSEEPSHHLAQAQVSLCPERKCTICVSLGPQPPSGSLARDQQGPLGLRGRDHLTFSTLCPPLPGGGGHGEGLQAHSWAGFPQGSSWHLPTGMRQSPPGPDQTG